MPGIDLVRTPNWQNKDAVLVTEVAQRHVNIHAVKEFPHKRLPVSFSSSSVSGSQYGGGGFIFSSVQNAFFEWDIGILKPGTWRWSFWGGVTPDAGITSFYFNGVLLGNSDRYAAVVSATPGIFEVPTFIVPATYQPNTIKTQVLNKNPASSGYLHYVSMHTLDWLF